MCDCLCVADGGTYHFWPVAQLNPRRQYNPYIIRYCDAGFCCTLLHSQIVNHNANDNINAVVGRTVNFKFVPSTKYGGWLVAQKPNPTALAKHL